MEREFKKEAREAATSDNVKKEETKENAGRQADTTHWCST
jgi:hypothetical protein